jgi:hypothetical protein
LEASIQASVRSLDKAADEAFVKTWAEYSDVASANGITASQVRSGTRWMITGYSLGICKASDRDLADWFTKFDALRLGRGPRAIDLRESLRRSGMDGLTEGQDGTELDELNSAERTRFCKVEMEAVRRVLARL